MRITFQPVRQIQSGFALLIVLTFLLVSLLVFASVMSWVFTTAKITQRNNTFNQSQAAAESATEYVISQMLNDFKGLCLNSSTVYEALPPTPTGDWPVQYTFSATNGDGNHVFVSIGPTNWTVLPSLYTGLQGLGQNCVIACTATPQGLPVNVPATVSQTVWFGSIPMCQYAVFYNVVLEINPGDTFTIAGRVHCNTNMYCTGAAANKLLTFQSNVDAAGTVSNTPSPLDPINGPPGGNRSGNVVYSSGPPMQGRDTLNLPLGNASTNYSFAALESLLQMPPATYALGTAAAYTTNGQVYFANEADFVITNDAATGTNITVLYQNQNLASPNYLLTVLPDAIGNIITNKSITTNGTINKTYITNYNYITNFYFSYVTNDIFYDYRESAPVKAIQFDVGQFGAWLSKTNIRGGWQYEDKNANSGGTTAKGNVICSVYFFNSVKPVKGSNLPAIRLVNGAQLPTNTYNNGSSTLQARGLGIATAQPIYVQGNYNVTVNNNTFAYALGSTTNGCTLPASLIGDAVTLLSSSFADYTSSATAPLKPTPTQNAITLNAACFEGIVPSDGGDYSGGLENFLRLLENWGTKTINYNGSIVVMFPSTYATNHWGGSYYGAPLRAWGFDATFLQASKQPPLFPSLKADARSAWTYK
jgi:hypothetical protein